MPAAEEHKGVPRLCLSTRWNAERHETGEALAEEILALGFSRVELSYDLTIDLVPGIRKMVDTGALTVETVHCFCPVPVGSPYGHPELFVATDQSERARQSAVTHLEESATFAAGLGASVIVVHGGRVEMRQLTRKLIALAGRGRKGSARYEKIKFRLLDRRARKADRYLDSLRRSLDELLPVLTELNVALALENLPSWEAVPTEMELVPLLQSYDSPFLRYWHDIGHGQVRENLGLIAQQPWFEQLRPFLAGMHVHDVAPPAADHLMPPRGDVDFSRFTEAARSGIPLVLEPVPGADPDDIRDAVQFLEETWAATGRPDGN